MRCPPAVAAAQVCSERRRVTKDGSGEVGWGGVIGKALVVGPGASGQ